MIWVRLAFSIVVGGLIGFGCFFISLGLLPEFPPLGPKPVPEKRIEFEDGVELIPPTGDSPIVRAEKRRMATASGIGCLVGGVSIISSFVLGRRLLITPK